MLQLINQTNRHWKIFLKCLISPLPSYPWDKWQNIKHSLFSKATKHCWVILLHQHHLVAAKADAPKCALYSISCALKNVNLLPDPVDLRWNSVGRGHEIGTKDDIYSFEIPPCSSDSLSLCPTDLRMALPSSLFEMVPSPFLSKRENTSLNSLICSSVNLAAIVAYLTVVWVWGLR